MQEQDPSYRSYLIADLPLHERPRERLLARGAQSLSDAELLGIVLRNGTAGRSALDLARDLLAKFHHDLGELSGANAGQLAEVRGIGPAKAAELQAVFALAQRLARHVQAERLRFNAPEPAVEYLRGLFRGKKQEELHSLLLDTKNALIRDEEITRGLLDRSQSHPREVFRPALHYSAAKILLAHNHPSGDPTPSPQDRETTRRLVAAGELLGIAVVDHIVVGQRQPDGSPDYYSFKEHGDM